MSQLAASQSPTVKTDYIPLSRFIDVFIARTSEPSEFLRFFHSAARYSRQIESTYRGDMSFKDV